MKVACVAGAGLDKDVQGPVVESPLKDHARVDLIRPNPRIGSSLWARRQDRI